VSGRSAGTDCAPGHALDAKAEGHLRSATHSFGLAPVSATSSDKRFLDEQKALACIHCGLCLSSCPTYLETGNENDSPRGRIYLMRAIQAGRMDLTEGNVGHLDLCLGCRACEAVCPSGVQYGALLEGTREHVESFYHRSFVQRFLRRVAIEKVFPFPSRMRLALLPARFARALGLARFLPKFGRDALSLIPSEMPNLPPLPELSPASTIEKRGRVGFVSGCVMSVMFQKTNASSVRLLNRAGYDVITPGSQVCCGALYAHGGSLAAARESARRNIQAFEPLELDAIVINAAGCGSTLKEYGHLLHDDPIWKERAEAFSKKVKDLTEWLLPLVPRLPKDESVKVTYHDACHLVHAQRVSRQPRELVQAVAGLNYVELPESDVCCGSAGTYNLTEPEMAARLQARKTQNILNTGALVVVTTNPGCLLQIRAGLEKAGAGHVHAVHIADFLESAFRQAQL
jgi:glycolate oxidase iron-sulfur subunit